MKILKIVRKLAVTLPRVLSSDPPSIWWIAMLRFQAGISSAMASPVGFLKVQVWFRNKEPNLAVSQKSFKIGVIQLSHLIR